MKDNNRFRQIIIGLMGGVIGIFLWAVDTGGGSDLLFLDFLQKNALPEIESKVAIVEIDPTTVESFGWPLPKEFYGGAIDLLHKAGAKGVGIDIFLTDREINFNAENEGSDKHEISSTEALGEIAKDTNTVFATYRITVNSAGKSSFPETAKGGRLECAVSDSNSYIKPLLPELRIRGIRSGHAHLIPNPEDGTHRIISPCVPIHDGCFADFASVLVGMLPKGEACTKPVIVPSFFSFKDFPRMSLHKIISISDQGDKQAVGELESFAKDRYIVIGLSDATLGDFGSTTHAAREPLLVLHANRIDSLLAGIRITEFSHSLLAIITIPLLLLTLVFLTRTRYLLFAATMGLFLYCGISAVAFRLAFSWVAPSPLVLPFVLGTVSAGIYASWRYYIFNKMLAQAFDSYVAPEVMDWLRETEGEALHPEAADRREITILFSDIAGFTSLSNSLDAHTVMEALRRYLDPMLEIVQKHKGYIDKIEGDGLMILFGAPKKFDDHAEKAVACAMKMQKEVEELQSKWQSLTGEKLLVRIGIATGKVFVGNLGSHGHIEYTSIGRDVNLAARLETSSENGGVLISEQTFSLLSEKPSGRWVEVKAKGYEKPIKAWQIPKDMSAKISET